MGSTSVVVAVVVAAFLAAGLWILVRRAIGGSRRYCTPVSQLSVTDARRAGPVFRSEVRASLTALLIGGLAGALTWQAGTWWPQGYGLAYALAGLVGASAGLVAYNLYPRKGWATDPGDRTHAELTPRGPTSFARQWIFGLPLATAVLLILGLVLTGLYSSTDENGLHRNYQRRGLAGWGVENGRIVDVQYNLSSSGPFPGWYYGIPVMISAVLLVLAVYWSLHRIASAARPASPSLFDVDTTLRSLRTVFVMAASSAALALEVAGLLVLTGNVLRSSHLDPVPTADLEAVPAWVPVQPGHTLALIAILSSVVIAVAAIVLLIRAVSVIGDLRTVGVARHSEAVPAR